MWAVQIWICVSFLVKPLTLSLRPGWEYFSSKWQSWRFTLWQYKFILKNAWHKTSEYSEFSIAPALNKYRGNQFSATRSCLSMLRFCDHRSQTLFENPIQSKGVRISWAGFYLEVLCRANEGVILLSTWPSVSVRWQSLNHKVTQEGFSCRAGRTRHGSCWKAMLLGTSSEATLLSSSIAA